MDDRVDTEPVPVQLHADRVGQERHVVGDDLDGRMRRLPAFDFELRIEHPHLARAGLALAREVQVRQRGAVEVEAALALEILWRDPEVVLADELLRLRGVRLGQMLAKPSANAIYQGLIERVNTSLRGPCDAGSMAASCAELSSRAFAYSLVS